MAFAGSGVVVLWDDRGFGFIRDDDSQERDLFVHAKDINNGAARRVKARVAYRVIHSPKGAQAVEVTLQKEAQHNEDGECDVLTEAEFLAELQQVNWLSAGTGLVLLARSHGWVDG